MTCCNDVFSKIPAHKAKQPSWSMALLAKFIADGVDHEALDRAKTRLIAEAIWSLVGFALGHFAKYLSPDKATDPAPTVQPPSTPAAPTQPAPGPSP